MTDPVKSDMLVNSHTPSSLSYHNYAKIISDPAWENKAYVHRIHACTYSYYGACVSSLSV